MSANTNSSAKRIALSAVIAALVVMGIALSVFWSDIAMWLELQAPTVVDGVEYSLVAEKRTYFVGEPFRFSLRARNVSDSPRTLPLDLNMGYEIEPFGTMNRSDEIRLVLSDVEPEPLAPRESKIVRLSLYSIFSVSRSSQDAGISLWQYSYFGAKHDRRQPKWSTMPIRIRCEVQQVRFPPGTPGNVAAALAELYDSPTFGFSIERLGTPKVSYNEAMRTIKALGPATADALLANVENYRIQPAVLQLLGDLQVTAAVPRLIGLLSAAEHEFDNSHSLVLTTLARITQHPEGYSFVGRAFDARVRKKAAAAYEAWWNSRQNRASTESAASS